MTSLQIYVVGGLVDRNRHKGATLRTALESEVKTKKIAVRKYVDLAHGSSEVLTLNQVQHEMQRSLKKI